MNTHIARWKKQYDAVQKVIDALPESRDHTAEVQVDDKKSRTLSDNLSHCDEENKNKEEPWGDQEPMNMNDHTMITEKKVKSGSKAGATKQAPESEPQEIPNSAMITPNTEQEEPVIKVEKGQKYDDHLQQTP